MTALEDTAESEATVVRDHQAVNRRTLADDKTVLMMIMMTTMMTVTIAADKMSGMKHIAIAIMIDDDMTQALKAHTEEEHEDLENQAIHLTGQDIQDTDRGQVPCTEIHSRRPAHTGLIHVPVHQDSHPVTTLDLTNLIATSRNVIPEDNTIHHPTINSTINILTSTIVHRAKHIISKDNGRINPDGCNRPTEAGWTCVPSIPGNPYAIICLQFRGGTTKCGCMATHFPWACKLNPSTGENFLR